MSEPFIGEIRMVGFNFAPRGWATCDGQLLPIAQNTALFSLLGTTYGGNGQTTFALPDLRGRLPLHQGQGPGLSTRLLGAGGGEEQVTVVVNQLPAHNHPSVVTTAQGQTAAPSGQLVAEGPSPRFNEETGAPRAAFAAQAVGPAGGSQPHPNLMPYLCVNFVIALEGIFPSRN